MTPQPKFTDTRSFMQYVESHRKTMHITTTRWAQYLNLHPSTYCDFREGRRELPAVQRMEMLETIHTTLKQ